MSDWAAVIVALVGLVQATVVAWFALKVAQLTTGVANVHKATNSLVDRLVKTTDAEAHGRGLSEGRAEHPR